MEEDDGGDDDGEGFFVPHGYLSDDEINDEEPEEVGNTADVRSYLRENALHDGISVNP